MSPIGHWPARFGQHADTFVFLSPCHGRGFRKLTESPLMWKAVLTLALLFPFSFRADARPPHHHHRRHHHHLYRSMAMVVGNIPDDERVVSGRPSGCPHAFCGCEASLFRFGRIIPELNLASNWRRFPRAAPATGMAAVRSGHVMILQRHVAGDVWYVHDGNSGGHVTREHPRSIAGYTIVDPSSSSALSRMSAGHGSWASSNRHAMARGWM
jgi:hypothetical protein